MTDKLIRAEAVRRAVLDQYTDVTEESMLVSNGIGAQQVDGRWYIPKWGCDTLEHVLDALLAEAQPEEPGLLVIPLDRVALLRADIIKDIDDAIAEAFHESTRPAGGRVLTEKQANDIEAEMRRMEADPAVSKHALRLYMQSTMPCGHAVGNLLTCDRPPNGCVICGDPSTRPAEEGLREALEKAAEFLHAAQENHTVDWSVVEIVDAALARGKGAGEGKP